VAWRLVPAAQRLQALRRGEPRAPGRLGARRRRMACPWCARPGPPGLQQHAEGEL